MFKINTEKELLGLLKVISEEAVKKSKNMLNEAVDTAQERYATSLKSSEGLYGVSLSEQEEAEESDAESKEKDITEPPESTEESEAADPEEFGVSFDSVIKDINNLRSGRSTKDKEIKDELLGYYDKLDEEERKILHLFLRELSNILKGALAAEDAVDPSDPPFNAEVTFGNNPEGNKTQDDAQDTTDTAENPGEDSSPPIKVNETQDLNEIRKKVSRLMKRY
mgnify:FL=1